MVVRACRGSLGGHGLRHGGVPNGPFRALSLPSPLASGRFVCRSRHVLTPIHIHTYCDGQVLFDPLMTRCCTRGPATTFAILCVASAVAVAALHESARRARLLSGSSDSGLLKGRCCWEGGAGGEVLKGRCGG